MLFALRSVNAGSVLIIAPNLDTAKENGFDFLHPMADTTGTGLRADCGRPYSKEDGLGRGGSRR
jgi:hypothetical protein